MTQPAAHGTICRSACRSSAPVHEQEVFAVARVLETAVTDPHRQAAVQPPSTGITVPLR